MFGIKLATFPSISARVLVLVLSEDPTKTFLRLVWMSFSKSESAMIPAQPARRRSVLRKRVMVRRMNNFVFSKLLR